MIRHYTRRCRRCDKLFRTTCKMGKYCNRCKKNNKGEKMYDDEMEEELEDTIGEEE
jgi:hypothetical protein